MRRNWIVWLVVIGMAAGGLAWRLWPVAIRPPVDPSGADQLLQVADRWWDAARDPRPHEIAAKDWPAVIRRYHPLAVHVAEEGVYIEFHRHQIESSGLFVLPTHSSFVPKRQGDPAFHAKAGRVYWYRIK